MTGGVSPPAGDSNGNRLGRRISIVWSSVGAASFVKVAIALVTRAPCNRLKGRIRTRSTRGPVARCRTTLDHGARPHRFGDAVRVHQQQILRLERDALVLIGCRRVDSYGESARRTEFQDVAAAHERGGLWPAEEYAVPA